MSTTVVVNGKKKASQPKKPKQRTVTRVINVAMAAPNKGGVPKGGSRRGNPSSRRDPISKVYSLHIPLTTECLGNVSTANAFSNGDYIINPSNTRTFPRLSKIAANFEMYDFSKLVFRFVSSSATAVASTNTALGTIMMNTNYDVVDPKFPSQIQMEDYGGIAEAVPSRNLSHTVNVRGMKGGLRADSDSSRLLRYNLSGTGVSPTYPANTSAHDYDLGRFQVASAGAQVSSVAGRLYVDYSLNLHRWKTDTITNQTDVSAHTRESPASSCTAAAQFGTSGSVLQSGSTFPIVVGTGSFILPVVGRYMIMILWTGTGIAVTPGGGSGANLSAVFAFGNGTLNAFTTFTATSATYHLVMDVLQDGMGVPNSFVMNTLTGLVGGTCDIWVSAVPSNLSSPERSVSDYDGLLHRMSLLSKEVDDYRRHVERKSDAYDDCHENDIVVVAPVNPPLRRSEPAGNFLMTRGPLPTVTYPSMASSVLSSIGLG